MSADQNNNTVNEEVLEAIPVAAQTISGRLDTLEGTSADTLQVSRDDLNEKKKESRISKIKEKVKDRLATRGEELGEKALEGTEETGKTAVKTGVRVLAEGLLGPLAPIVDVGAELIGHDVGDLVMGGFGKFFKKKEETADEDDQTAETLDSSAQNLNDATDEFKKGYQRSLETVNSSNTPAEIQDAFDSLSDEAKKGWAQANDVTNEVFGTAEGDEERHKLLTDLVNFEDKNTERDTEHQEDMLYETTKMRKAIEKGGGGDSGGGLLGTLGAAGVAAAVLAGGALVTSLTTLGASIYTAVELRDRDSEALADQANIAKMKNKLSEDEAKQVGMNAQDIAAGTSGGNLITRRVLEQQGDLSSDQLGAKKQVAQRKMNDLQGQISLLESQQKTFVDSGVWGQLGATLANNRFTSEDEEKLNRLKEQEVQQRGTLSSIDDAVYVAKEREKKGTESAVDTTPIEKALNIAEESGLTPTTQSKEIQKVVPIQSEVPTPDVDNGLKEVASAVTNVGNGLKETTAKMLALASAKPPVPIHAGLNNQIDMISDGPTVLAASGMLS